jgi:hypothetical protein
MMSVIFALSLRFWFTYDVPRPTTVLPPTGEPRASENWTVKSMALRVLTLFLEGKSYQCPS